MYDNVHVIEDDPLLVGQPLDMPRPGPRLLQPLFHMRDHGLDLGSGFPAGHHEVVADRREFAQVEDENVARLLFQRQTPRLPGEVMG